MAKLSVIVAVYNSERYLAACIESILKQPIELELIAVNDASPDGSHTLLSQYATKDDRIRVISLPNNFGVSGARNTGLEIATGDYIWFVDGDDWLVENAAKKLLDRGCSTNADVVLMGWWEVGRDGTKWRGEEQDLLPLLPSIFTLNEAPQCFSLPQHGWAKIIRRDLLVSSGIRFARCMSDIYQGAAFTYPLFAKAKTITALPDPCLYFRAHSTQQTKSQSDRHFDVFPQWRLAFSRLDEADLTPETKKWMVWKMIDHQTHVFWAGRVPPASRVRFFKEIRKCYVDATLGRPFWPQTLPEAAIQLNSYNAFCAALTAHKAAGRLRRSFRSGSRQRDISRSTQR